MQTEKPIQATKYLKAAIFLLLAAILLHVGASITGVARGF